MRHFRLLIESAIIWLFTSGLGIAQNIEFEPVIAEKGLSQNFIHSISEDDFGFLWIATPTGLNRYDGYDFKEYSHHPSDSTTISSNRAKVVLNDHSGNLWIGHDRGLELYHPETGVFEKISLGKEVEITRIINGYDNDIWVLDTDYTLYNIKRNSAKGTAFDAKPFTSTCSKLPSKAKNMGRICLDSSNRLWIYHPSLIEVVEFRGDAFHSQFVDCSKIFENPEVDLEQVLNEQRPTELAELQGMIQGRDGIIWLFSKKMLAKIEGKNVTSLNVLDLPNSDQVLIHEASYHGLHDSENFLWLCSSLQNTHFVIDLNKMVIHPHSYKSYEQIEVGITSMIESENGSIWLGTNGNGLYKGVRHKEIFDDPPASQKVETGSIHTICKDYDGNIWFYSKRHLNVIRTGESKAEKILGPASVSTTNIIGDSSDYRHINFILPEKKGTVWYGHSKGLYRLTVDQGQILRNQFYPLLKKGEGAAIDTIRGACDMAIDDKGKLWVVTTTELGVFNPETGYFDGRPYRERSSIEDNNKAIVNKLLYTVPNTLWIGSASGLFRYEVAENELTFFENSQDDPKSISSEKIRSLHQDPLDPNIIWIGTYGSGLDRFNSSTNEFEHYTTSNGLPDQTIYGILSDGQKKLWLSTNKGLCSFNLENRAFNTYNKRDGLQDNEFNNHSYFQSQDGELIFGGIHGLNRFYPEQLYQSTYQPRTIITEVKINNEPIEFKTSQDVLSHQIESASDIFIDHHVKMISLSLAGLDLSMPQKIEYQYQLKGFSEDWIKIGKGNVLTFTSLPYGDYTLKLRSTNRSGQWSENITELNIHALTPWWLRWWAYSLYAVILTIVVFATYRFQLKRENERREAQRLLELDTFKSRLFTNITHEFRTPLTVIMGMTGMIKDQEEFTEPIQSNARNLLQMVNQILDLAKLESKKLEINYINGNIVEYLKHLTSTLEPIANQQNKTLRFLASPDTVVMDYDEMKIRHILINLLSNALKFSSQGDEITVEVNKIHQDTLKFSVSDTGVGIPEEKLDKIFDRFYQADDSSTRRVGGTGIGLALCYELVELLGGEFKVESKLDVGSKFSLTLPIFNKSAQGEFSLLDESMPRSDFSKNPKQRTPEDPSKPLLLLIEDNYEIVHFIEMLLDAEYRIVHAENGLRGIEEAISIIPDIIISDVMMPLKNGYEVTETLKADIRTSHVPIILLTAKSSQADKNTGLEKGADAYLRKPFDQAELQIRLKKLIELRQSLIKKFKGLEESTEQTDQLENEFLSQVKQVVLDNLQNTEFNIEFLEESMKLSKMQLYRKLKALTGMSPTLVIRNIRLNRAAELLKEGSLNVSEVAYEVGFNDPSYFTRAFKEQFGKSPSEFI